MSWRYNFGDFHYEMMEEIRLRKLAGVSSKKPTLEEMDNRFPSFTGGSTHTRRTSTNTPRKR